jgi:hypothetical protein
MAGVVPEHGSNALELLSTLSGSAVRQLEPESYSDSCKLEKAFVTDRWPSATGLIPENADFVSNQEGSSIRMRLGRLWL